MEQHINPPEPCNLCEICDEPCAQTICRQCYIDQVQDLERDEL
jgi:hypothetical protein